MRMRMQTQVRRMALVSTAACRAWPLIDGTVDSCRHLHLQAEMPQAWCF